jgi:hypothetical protein
MLTPPKGSDEQIANAMSKYDRDSRDLHRNLGSRIVIAREIRNKDVARRWGKAVANYLDDYDENKLEAAFDSLVKDIVEIGLKA